MHKQSAETARLKSLQKAFVTSTRSQAVYHLKKNCGQGEDEDVKVRFI